MAANAESSRNPDGGEPQQAPFVCYLHPVDTETEEAFNSFAQGEFIEDHEHSGLRLGATQTIGSVAAVEAVLRKNLRDHGKGITTEGLPTFSFANSTEDRCLSTARLGVSANGAPGEISVHTLEKGQSPILFSIETLRRLGALIDFSSDHVVFRSLDPRRIVKLGRSRTWHQLLSLTNDWLGNEHLAEADVPGLAAYLKPL